MASKKFYIGSLDIRNGEYEYEVHVKMALHPNASPSVALDKHGKSFYSGGAEKEDGGYYFHGRCVFVSAGNSKEISESTYNDLDGVVVNL